MPVSPKNLVFIMSDEHTRSVLGCYGNRVVHTPNLDRLAAEGTRFTNAYTPSPVCVSARASLATGRWVHDTGAWSSAEPYDGAISGWGHRLIEAGHARSEAVQPAPVPPVRDSTSSAASVGGPPISASSSRARSFP